MNHPDDWPEGFSCKYTGGLFKSYDVCEHYLFNDVVVVHGFHNGRLEYQGNDPDVGAYVISCIEKHIAYDRKIADEESEHLAAEYRDGEKIKRDAVDGLFASHSQFAKPP